MRSIWRRRHRWLRRARHWRWRLKWGAPARRSRPDGPESYGHRLVEFACPIVNHPSQRELVANKIWNMQIAVERIDGLVLAPGAWFSFWDTLPEPEIASGYKAGPTFEESRVTTSVGGGLCQISGLLYNLALLGDFEILERHPHSIDAYGDRRYLPLGRDATVAFQSKDLAFRNAWPWHVRIRLELVEGGVRGWLESAEPWEIAVRFESTQRDLPGGVREVVLLREAPHGRYETRDVYATPRT